MSMYMCLDLLWHLIICFTVECVCSFVYFLYCFLWKWFLPFTLPALLAGVLYVELIDLLTPGKAIAVYLMLAGMVVIAWWQWDTAERFRERLAALEDRMEKQTVYYRLDENGEEKICDY